MRFVVLFALIGLPAAAQVTFSRDVSRIMQSKCQQCHRPNDIAPFALTTYAEAAEWAADIKRAVETKIMPPWKPVEGHGEFRNSLALSEEQRRTIIDWVDAGAPEGDPADLPEPIAETGEWPLGEPDIVVQMAEPYSPKPRVRDDYRCFVLPYEFTERTWATAVDVIPGDRRLVHHVLLFLDRSGEGERKDAEEDGPGYTCFGGPGIMLSATGGLGGWVPGMRTSHTPEGVGLLIPKGSRIIMQVHYHPHGEIGVDQTKVGIYLAKSTPEKPLIYLPLVNTSFRIPAGAQNYNVTASAVVYPGLSAKAIVAAPHMHLLGRQIRVDLFEPGRDPRPLIYIDDWDFHWQGFYTYNEAIPLRTFSRVQLTCTFDNSETNPRNPSRPPKEVGWGEGTEDEMCLAFLGVTFDNLSAELLELLLMF